MMLLSLFLFIAVLSTDVLGAVKGRRAKDYCIEDSGVRHALHETWDEGIQRCNCVYPESHLYFWDGRNPSDARPFCLINGCPDPSGGRLLKHREQFFNSNGDRCTCRRGTNPRLMDAYTLYHAVCSRGLKGNDKYYIDFRN